MVGEAGVNHLFLSLINPWFFMGMSNSLIILEHKFWGFLIFNYELGNNHRIK